MKMKYFGTDGIRGKMGTPAMDEAFARKFAIALGHYLRMRHPNGEIHLVIGRDTRSSGIKLEETIIDAIKPFGISIDRMGVLPTPAVSFWVDELEADNGLVITASHNPSSYNGFKLFNAHGVKQTIDKEAIMDALIDEGIPEDLPRYKKGEILHHPEAISIYVDNVCELMPKRSLTGWKIVLDMANGATTESSKKTFQYFGADLSLIGNLPDGNNINDGVGSENPERMCEEVKRFNANVGISHDGDGDRVLMSDENGDIVPGEQLLGLLTLHAMEKGYLHKNTLVTTIQSNLGLDKAIEKAGGHVVRTNVGDREVYQAMYKHGYSIGGESSGHFIFDDYAQSGDGLLAAIKVIEVMLETGKPLSELRKQVSLMPSKSSDLLVEEKLPLEDLPKLQEAIESVRAELGDKGRLLVRYSGTEPKIRLLVEATDQSQVDQCMDQLIQAVNESLKVAQ